MAWSDLTLTRDDIDAFEKQTFRDLNVTVGNTELRLDEKDNLMLSKSKQILESDVADKLQHLINDETFASETDLLDGIYGADTRGLLKDLLVYKFLEVWFFQDSTHADSKAMIAAQKYNNMYTHYLDINLRRLSGALSTPKASSHYVFRGTYG
jgi:hypothetical protein